jgi:hypothetical protein
MVGVALEEAPALELCLVPCALQLLLTQGIGLLDAACDLVLDCEGNFDCGGCDGAQQQLAHRRVDIGIANLLTRLSGPTHAFLGAHVVRNYSTSELLIAGPHPGAAQTAQNVSLQERRSFAR